MRGGGVDTTTEQTFELYKKLKLRLLENHFVIRKWRTNDKLLREKINLSEPNESIVSSKEKLLGITWDDANDEFVYNLDETIVNRNHAQSTKRQVLSIICSFYDPIGIIQPIVVSLKILFQEICKTNIDWDEQLPFDLNEK